MGGAYARHSDPEQHAVGKEQTQKIASKHSNVRTRIKRLVRRTIGFAKTTTMHDLVIGLRIKRYEFGGAIEHRINTFEHLRHLKPEILLHPPPKAIRHVLSKLNQVGLTVSYGDLGSSCPSFCAIFILWRNIIPSKEDFPLANCCAGLAQAESTR